MYNLHSMKSIETWVCKIASSKNKGRCRDGAVRTCKVGQNHMTEKPQEQGGGPVHAKRGVSWSMQQGGGPVHANPGH